MIRRRNPARADGLPATLHPVLRRVYAGRGIQSAEELETGLDRLLPPTLAGLEAACELLGSSLMARERIVICGDYDADGATSTALAVSTLRELGGDVDFCVPDRFRMGYGLSPELAEQAAATGARTLVTVDCGIASHAGVRAAKVLAMRVIITDHHLPGPDLPDADAIVNPNCGGDPFPSKHLAGVGVMFYLLTALRVHLRGKGWFDRRPEPRLSTGLDLVALGTVADLVRLDTNNRLLVGQGLRRIRAGQARPGIQALLQVAGRVPERVYASDLGFSVGPRLNAAGRLTDMRLGIQCLLAPDMASAQALATKLEQLNLERRDLQAKMEVSASDLAVDNVSVGVSLFDPGWHEGVVGLVASRMKEKLHRPVIAFARAQQAGMLKGSARSIPGLHIRDALVAVDAGSPGLINRFGGHAMAAGLSLAESRFEEFRTIFDQVCRAAVPASALERHIETDGELNEEEFSLETAQVLEQGGPWGQGFPEPLFDGLFSIESARVVGDVHVKYRLRTGGGKGVSAIHFRGLGAMRSSGQARFVYRPVISRWRGEELEMQVQELLPA